MNRPQRQKSKRRSPAAGAFSSSRSWWSVIIALGVWWRSTYSEDTDDAQVNGHLIQVSARINGQVLKVDVEENQVVKAGDPIAELDPRDYQVAVENAEAALASAQANAAAANVNVPITTINTGSNLTLRRRRRERARKQEWRRRKSSSRLRTRAWPRPRPTTPKRRPIWSATSRWWRKT